MSKFEKGHSTWNKGLKGYGAGRIVSDETRKKQSDALIGENAPNWRGGKSSEDDLIRKRRSMYHWKRAVWAKDNHICQECGAKPEKLIADHIKPFCTHPKLRLDISNGRTLCVECHRKTPTYGVSKKYQEKVAAEVQG